MPGSAKKRSFLTPTQLAPHNSAQPRVHASTGPEGFDRRKKGRDRRRSRSEGRSARARDERRARPGRRHDDLPRSRWAHLPGMIASGCLGVVAALALSARAQTPTSGSSLMLGAEAQRAAVGPRAKLADEALPRDVAYRAGLSAADQNWLDDFESELRGTTGAELVVDESIRVAMLERSEALEALYCAELTPKTRSQLDTIEAELLRLGVWREAPRRRPTAH